MSKKLFDFAIGNPPYQAVQEVPEASEGNKSFAKPVYNEFLDAAYSVADKVEMIHPARFLFNAGSTPKDWNERMLNDEHLKVLAYESDSQKIFPTNQITGGIAVTYRDEDKDFGCISVFTPFFELSNILRKVMHSSSFKSMEPIVITRTAYRLTDKLHADHPEAKGCLSDGHAYDMSSNIFERLPQVFSTEEPNDGLDYIRVLGREANQRTYKYIRRDYVNNVKNLDKYKVLLAKADGAAGTIGKPIPARVTGMPSIEPPKTGTTESFISIGSFDTQYEAQAAMDYVKTKFARTLLSVLKVTQEITPGKWKYVPLQDFTSASDIDWRKSIPEIDRQLYAKYGLSTDEIEFIESHVKEMI